MDFEKHSYLEGKHAFLSASKPSWVNYDDDKMARAWLSSQAAKRGTELHKLAHELIKHGVRLPDDPVTTLALYVNDAIGYRMSPEQALFVSENCFGTADAIACRNNVLRVSDLKNGIIDSKFLQLEIYAAMFCLEYKFRPWDLQIELRIYQNNEVRFELADSDWIFTLMDRIETADPIIRELREERE